MRKKIHHIFLLNGVLLSVAFGIASNNGIDAAGIGFVITAFGAVLILSLYRFPVAGMIGNFVKIVKCFVLAGTLGITLFLRIFAVYRDGTLEQLQCKITHGPAKGLYTTQEHLEQYNNVIDDIHTYVNRRCTDKYIYYETGSMGVFMHRCPLCCISDMAHAVFRSYVGNIFSGSSPA